MKRLARSLLRRDLQQEILNTLRERLAEVPRPVAAGGAVAAILVLAGLFSLPRLFDGTHQGEILAQQLAQITGQHVRINGGVKVSLWPSPHLEVRGLLLTAADNRTVLLDAPRLDLKVTFASLMAGSFNAKEITLHQPQIKLQTTTSATFLKSLTALPVDSLTLDDADVLLPGLGGKEHITQMSGEVHLHSFTSLLQTELEAEWRQAPVKLTLDISRPEADGTALTLANLELGAVETSVFYNGRLDATSGTWRADGQLDMSAAQAATLWATAASLGLSEAAPADPALAGKLLFSTRLKGDANAYNLEAIGLSLGDWQAKGLARLTTGAKGGLSLALQGDVLDLGQWPGLLTRAGQGNWSLPADWLGAFDLSLAGLRLDKLVTGPVSLKGDVRSSTLNLTTAETTLPGGGKLSFAGKLAAKPGQSVAASGQLKAESPQFRELLSALSYQLPQGLSDSALRQFKLEARVEGPWRKWSLPDFNLTLDGTQISGQVSPRSSDGVFDTTLNIDQLALDAYAGGDMALPAWLWALPPTNFNVSIKQLRAGDLLAERVTLGAMLAQERLTLNNFAAVDFGGNSVRLSGSLSRDISQDADFTLRIATPDYTRLTQTFAPVASLIPSRLGATLAGPLELAVRWRQSKGEVQQLCSINFGAGKVDLVVSQAEPAPRRFKLRLQHREVAEILRRLAPTLLQRETALLGPIDAYVEGVDLGSGRWQLSALQGQIAGFKLANGELTVTDGKPLLVVGNLDVREGNLELWRQTLQAVPVTDYVQGSVQVHAGSLKVAGDLLTNVNGHLVLAAPAAFGIEKMSADWREGKVEMNGTLGLSPGLTLKGTLDIKGANARWQGGDRFGMEGVTDISLSLEGSGNDWPSLQASLSGDGEIAVDSGELHGFDFATMTSALKDRRHPPSLPALLAQGGTSVLSSFGGDFTIEDGKLTASQLRLRTPSASADLKAELEIPSRRLTTTSTVTLREVTGAPPFSVQLAGPVDAVEPLFETAALGQFVSGSGDKALSAKAEWKPDLPKDETEPVADGQSKPVAKASPRKEAAPKDETDAQDASLEEPVPPALPSAKDESSSLEAVNARAGASVPDDVEPVAAAPAPAPAPTIRKAAPAPAASASANDDPTRLDVKEMLRLMPSMMDQAQTVVEQARRATPSTPTTPRSSVVQSPTPKPQMFYAPTGSEALGGALAPEFSGQQVAPVRSSQNGREIRTEGLTIRLPPKVDVIKPTEPATIPPASAEDLLGQSREE